MFYIIATSFESIITFLYIFIDCSITCTKR